MMRARISRRFSIKAKTLMDGGADFHIGPVFFYCAACPNVDARKGD
jgi:hypothetical protein